MIDDDKKELLAQEKRKKRRLSADLGGALFSVLALCGIFFPGVRGLLMVGAIGGFFSGVGFSMAADVSLLNKTPKQLGEKATRHFGDTINNMLYAAGATSTLGFIVTAVGLGLAASTFGAAALIAAPAIFAVSAACWGISAALDFYNKPSLASAFGLTAASTNMIAAGIALGLVLGATGPALPFVLGAAAVVSAVTWVASAYLNRKAHQKALALEKESIELDKLVDDRDELEFSPGLGQRLAQTQEAYHNPSPLQASHEETPLLSDFNRHHSSTQSENIELQQDALPTLKTIKSQIMTSVDGQEKFQEHHIQTHIKDGLESIRILNADENTTLEVAQKDDCFDFKTAQKWVPPETISLMAISLLKVGEKPEIYGGSCHEVYALLNEMEKHRDTEQIIEPTLPEYFSQEDIERCQPLLDRLKVAKNELESSPSITPSI